MAVFVYERPDSLPLLMSRVKDAEGALRSRMVMVIVRMDVQKFCELCDESRIA